MVKPIEGSHLTTLDKRHITNYLALSRLHPLDILVDARDPDWDFAEEDVTVSLMGEVYHPPFSASHMEKVFQLLLPHLPRWRTLSILTDTWAPMHSALHTINTTIITQRAPMLESLTLMRCNDFVSFSSDFQPAALKSPAFLAPPDGTDVESLHSETASILPRLKHLSLRGVHVHWASLGAALSTSRTGLYSLDLGSHCSDIRPSSPEFHHLLTSNPRLRKLIVSGSGPIVLSEPLQRESDAVLLPNLVSLTLGYRSSMEGQAILQMINAPSLTSLMLEEATYPADPDDVDAGTLLTYLGTGEFQTVKERCIALYELQQQFMSKPRKDSTSSIASTSTCVGSSVEIDGRLFEEDGDDDMTLVDFDMKPHSPFPLLETVTLRNVRAKCLQPISEFIGSLNHVRSLEMSNMSMKNVQALLPDSTLALKCLSIDQASTSSSLAPTCLPCPQLQSLCLREFDMDPQDLDFVLSRLVGDRKAQGLCHLTNVDVHLGSNSTVASCEIRQNGCTSSLGDALREQDEVTFTQAGVTVNLMQRFSDEEEEDLDGVGDAFNDPHFDAFYANSLVFADASR
ncbi:hypothetical protein FA15DRAFT_600902 [Coprinopsis marcescibilis]|uniref:F-box domain-containing protein n=1 Tax=Coprinopsis marcescibilis TaxID=230819 RepID=A0A5C3KHT0_COPMA|nr:hypothetical protein FA15DRAFT_600902 [Coprinopsis marcescibilis]